MTSRKATCHPPTRSREARAPRLQTKQDKGVSYSQQGKAIWLDLNILETAVGQAVLQC